jgi:hypothetical protein
METDVIAAIQRIVDQVSQEAYRKGYSDAMAGKPPQHQPLKVIATELPIRSKRSRLEAGKTDEWVSSVMIADWQAIPTIVKRIKDRFRLDPGSETIRAAAHRMARAGRIDKHRLKPLFRKKNAA